MDSRFRNIRIALSLTALAGTAACAAAPGDESSRYRVVTTPGPRGTTRIVETEPAARAAATAPQPCSSQTATRERPKYRLVTTPGPRGTTRAVRVRGTGASCR